MSEKDFEREIRAIKERNKRVETDKAWERLKAGGEGDDRRRDGWMASLTQWTSV